MERSLHTPQTFFKPVEYFPPIIPGDDRPPGRLSAGLLLQAPESLPWLCLGKG